MTTALRPSGEYGQVSISSASRHWPVTKARLLRTDPAKFDPVAINGSNMTGTAIVIEDAVALIDTTPGMIYYHNIRNVRTYAAEAEATFGTIAEGAPVYYDKSSTMPANVFLSTSPLDKDGGTNQLFGYVVMGKGEVSADFPKGLATVNSIGAAVMQVGAGN